VNDSPYSLIGRFCSNGNLIRALFYLKLFIANEPTDTKILHNATTVADFSQNFGHGWKSRGFSVVMGAEALP
jgi:hypothetical protein